MTLLLLCMALFSTIFMVIFGMWWDDNLPFKIHFALFVIVIITIISILLLITIFPILKPRPVSPSKRKNLNNIEWGTVSSKLSTPAAILDGYSVIFANNMFLSELGLSGISELIIGMPLTNLVHPADHVNLAKAIASLSNEHLQNETTTIRMLYVDGASIPVNISFSSLNENDERDLKLLQFSSTSYHKPVISNPDEQLDYHLIVDSLEEIVFQINVDQKLIFLNPSWERILDHTHEDSLNKSLLSFIHPEDLKLVEAHLGPLTQGKRNSCHLQTRIIAKNGASLWVEMRATTTSSLKGERSGVIGTLTNINRMKQAEIRLKTNKYSTLDMIISNIPAMIYRCKNDRNWSFEFASDGCFQVTEYQHHEIVGSSSSSNFSYMQIIHPDDKSYAWELIQKQILKEQKFQLIYRIITRSGKVKWVLEQGEGTYSSTGELLSLEGFITEITLANDNTEQPLKELQKLIALPENR